MRGKPIIQWMLFLGAWVCLALPITLVTRGRQTVPAAQRTEGSTVMTWATLRFSAAPSYFELLQNGKVVWRENPAVGTEFDHSFPVSMDEFGAEFILKSRLPAAGAIEITIEPDERPERSQTLWANREVDEPLTFSWSRND